MARRSRKNITRASAIPQPTIDRYHRPAVVLRPIPAAYSPRIIARLEDRRQYHPSALPPSASHLFRPVAALSRASVQVIERPNPSRPNRPGRLTFSIPKDVSICAKRKIRRNVLFAFNRTRRGAGAHRRRRNFWSKISCSAR